MYHVYAIDRRIQSAYQNVIVGRPDSRHVVGEFKSLKAAIEAAHAYSQTSPEYMGGPI